MVGSVEDHAGPELVALGFDAEDPLALARFWAEALRWEVGERAGDHVDLVPTDGTRFTVRFRPTTRAKSVQNRLHLDLTTTSVDDQESTVEQLVGLGARHLDIGQRPEEGHVVLADPEGNELCIIAPGNAFLAGCGRLGSITCEGRREVGCFWSAALGWPLVWNQDEETAVRAPDGTGPLVTWGGPPIPPKDGANRLHLELATRVGADRGAAVDRLVALGARPVDAGTDDGGWTVMADPDDNEFFVLEAEG